METINDRMEKVVNECFNGNKAAFAKTIGLPPSGLSNYLGNKRRSKPSVDMVARIMEGVKSINSVWLLTGEGEMLKAPTGNTVSADGNRGIVTGGNNSGINVVNGVEVKDGGAVVKLRAEVDRLNDIIRMKDELIKAKEETIAALKSR